MGGRVGERDGQGPLTKQKTPVRDTRGPVDTLGRETVYWPLGCGNVSIKVAKVKQNRGLGIRATFPHNPGKRHHRRERLQMKTATTVILIIACIFAADTLAAERGPTVAVDLELVLAVDVSGSIDEEEGRLQRQGYIDAIADPEILRAIKSGILGRIAVSYVEWAGQGWQQTVLDWTIIDNAASARDFAARLAAAPIGFGPWTSISEAIDYATASIEGNAIEGTRRIIDISGDGPNNIGGPVPPARKTAISRGLSINGLVIINDRLNFGRTPMQNLDLYYRHCVIGGRGAFLVIARGFKDFARAIRRKLILEIANAPTGQNPIRTAGQAAQNTVQRRIPPCDEGERRFRGIIDDE
jgi:hypothetical protein